MAMPAAAEDSEEMVSDVVSRYERKGFLGQVAARPAARILCRGCGRESPARKVSLKALHRFEGMSDPDDMAVVAGVVCPACGQWATMVLAFGPEAAPEEREVLRALLDDRAGSSIRSGT